MERYSKEELSKWPLAARCARLNISFWKYFEKFNCNTKKIKELVEELECQLDQSLFQQSEDRNA